MTLVTMLSTWNPCHSVLLSIDKYFTMKFIEIIINKPFTILALDTVDPAIWSSQQFKKAFIKELLKIVESKKSEIKRLAAYVVGIIKNKHKCPWPELDIVQKYIDDMNINMLGDKHNV